MKFTIALLLLLGAAPLMGQENGRRVVATIHSKILGEDRSIFFHVPDGLSATRLAHVIYVLDAEAQFDNVLGALRAARSRPGSASTVLLVGVGNIWHRYRDYTPTRIVASPYVDADTAATTGGGAKFISFLEKELIPHVNAKYPVTATRMIVGHSLGGLLAVDVLSRRPTLFTHYIAIDPSMWWDAQRLLTTLESDFAARRFDGRSLFLAVASTEVKELSQPSLRLAQLLSRAEPRGLKFEFRRYDDEDHMSVFRPAVEDAMKFALGSMR
jgi:predicted alpha/beta superfamily hydrolase